MLRPAVHAESQVDEDLLHALPDEKQVHCNMHLLEKAMTAVRHVRSTARARCSGSAALLLRTVFA